MDIFLFYTCLFFAFLLLVIRFARAVESFKVRTGSDKSGHLSMYLEYLLQKRRKKENNLEYGYYVSDKDFSWKPYLLTQLMVPFFNPLKLSHYKWMQLIYSSVFDIISFLPALYLLSSAREGYSLQFLWLLLITYTVLPHLNSFRIRVESFGQRTALSMILQGFLILVYLLEFSNLNAIATLVGNLATWCLFLFVCFRTALFATQAMIFVVFFFPLFSGDFSSIAALGLFCILSVVFDREYFTNRIMSQFYIFRMQKLSRRNQKGAQIGSSKLLQSFYRIVYGIVILKFIRFLFQKSNTAKKEELQDRNHDQADSTLVRFSKRIFKLMDFAITDELLRMVIVYSVFVIPIFVLGLSVEWNTITDVWFSEMHKVFGKKVLAIYQSLVLATILVLIIPRLVVIGEASRYVEQVLPQTMIFFVLAVEALNPNQVENFVYTVFALSASISIWKHFYFHLKYYGRNVWQEIKKNLFAIFLKPPSNFALNETALLDKFYDCMAPREDRKIKVLTLPMKVCSALLIASLQRETFRNKFSIYSTWRDINILSNLEIFKSSYMFPQPANYKALLKADVLIVSKDNLDLYFDFLKKKEYKEIDIKNEEYRIFLKDESILA